MALIQMNYNSKALFRTVPVNVILPADRFDSDTDTYTEDKNCKYKTLYLLHGLLGNYTDWVSYTRIHRWAEEKNLAVVMPSGDNSFYFKSRTPWNDYETFIGEELVDMTRRMFPLSDKREDTFIAGLSMGGRGAITYSWAHPEKFAAAYSMSWVPQNMRQIAEELEKSKDVPLSPKDRLGKERNRIRLQNAGGPQAYLASPYNTWDRAAEWAGRPGMPKTFFSCGTEDTVMYRRFREFRAYAEKIGLEAEFTEREGYGHEWRFWDLEIRRAIDLFLPEHR